MDFDIRSAQEEVVVWFPEGKLLQLSVGRTWTSQIHCKEHSNIFGVAFVLHALKTEG